MKKLFIFTMLVSLGLSAVEIIEIKKNLILIESDADLDSPLVEGKTYRTDSSGSEVKIQKVKKNKAVGIIISGLPQLTEKINVQPSGPEPSNAIETKVKAIEKVTTERNVGLDDKKKSIGNVSLPIETEIKRQKTKSKFSYGILFGATNDSMNTEIRDQFNRVERINLKGTSSTYGLGLDYYTTDNFALRTELSSTTLKVNGSSTLFGCDSNTSTNCDANISFLSIGAILKYLFITESPRFHLRAGLDFLSASSKKSNFIKTNEVSSFQAFRVGLGIEINVAENFYIPLTLDYSSFPATNTVNTSKITITTGLSYE